MSSKSYEQLVQRKINSPRAQSEHCAEIQLQPEDSTDDDGELVRVRWNPEESMS